MEDEKKQLTVWVWEPKSLIVFPPSHLCCPITHEMFVEPVVLETGHMYEREKIKEWLQNNNTDPNTNVQLITRRMTPVVAKIADIDRWRTKEKLLSNDTLYTLLANGDTAALDQCVLFDSQLRVPLLQPRQADREMFEPLLYHPFAKRPGYLYPSVVAVLFAGKTSRGTKSGIAQYFIRACESKSEAWQLLGALAMVGDEAGYERMLTIIGPLTQSDLRTAFLRMNHTGDRFFYNKLETHHRQMLLTDSVTTGNPNDVRRCLRWDKKVSPSLFQFVYSVDMAKVIVENGQIDLGTTTDAEDANDFAGHVALHYTSKIDVAQYLITQGATLHATCPCNREGGYNILRHLAGKVDDESAVEVVTFMKLMHDAGLSAATLRGDGVNWYDASNVIDDEREDPLFQLIDRHQFRLALAFVEDGAPVNSRIEGGDEDDTLLHKLARMNSENSDSYRALVKRLWSREAVVATNEVGHTPMQIAKRRESKGFLSAVQQARAAFVQRIDEMADQVPKLLKAREEDAAQIAALKSELAEMKQLVRDGLTPIREGFKQIQTQVDRLATSTAYVAAASALQQQGIASTAAASSSSVAAEPTAIRRSGRGTKRKGGNSE
jgi:hypothetical protein